MATRFPDRVRRIAEMDSEGLYIDDLRYGAFGPFHLAVGSGQCVGISGPSGAGKSLFLRAVADMIPHSGVVRLDGTPSGSIAGHEWRRRVGLLPAESAWWAETVGDHFSADATGEFQRLGFSREVMDRMVSRLSSGERQRLSLLRLLAVAPRALLLDEPTANLDADNAVRVEELVADYRKEGRVPVLWVGHDPEQLRRVADRLFTLENGRLVSA